MVYRFAFIAEEADDFLREITISADATFYDFHQAIIKSCDYADDQMTSFFLCNEEWEQGVEITLEEMCSTSAEEDSFVMRDTVIADLVEEEHQRLVYRFDPLEERYFFIELREIMNGHQSEAICSRKKGMPPPQTRMDFGVSSQSVSGDDISLDDEVFFIEDQYNAEELDPEGFDISDEETLSN